MFIILTGSSGVGKNTIIKEIEKTNPNIQLMPTYTTRTKRPTEVEGYPFHFISKEEFQEKIRNNELIEYEFIHNNYYGSSFKIFHDFLSEGKILIKDIGVEGAQNLSCKIQEETPVVKIFLVTKSKRELKKRLKGRGEKNIKLRLKRFRKEQREVDKFDYVILNEELEKTKNVIQSVHAITPEEILPTKPVGRLRPKKLKKIISLLQSGRILKPIKVAIKGENLYVIKGHEKLLASIYTQKPVAKFIVDAKEIPELSVAEIMEWKGKMHQI